VTGAEDDPRPRLLAVARAAASERGWPWLEPVDVSLSAVSPERLWSIRTNAHAVGTSIRILIRESDAAILQAAFLPR
jgi:hypothetical protein